ncbi:MAG: alpha/beta hydrolase [Candidatus Spechtbacterales bacterium]
MKRCVGVKLTNGEECLVAFSHRKTGKDDEKQTVIMIHGLGSCGNVLDRTLATSLITKAKAEGVGLDVFTLDLPGHGDSDKNLQKFSTDISADALLGFMEAKGLSSAHVYGVSLGGSTAIKFASKHPDKIRSLSVQGPPINGRDWKLLRVLHGPALSPRYLLKLLKLNGFKPFTRLPEEKVLRILRGLNPGTDLGSLRRVCELNKDMEGILIEGIKKLSAVAVMDYACDIMELDLRKELENIALYKIPLMVVDGEKPEHRGVDTMERIAKIVPSARTLQIKGEGHLATVLGHETVAENLLDFIKNGSLQ